MRAQRLYNDRRWPNPVVLKITHAQPGMIPPAVTTSAAVWDAASGVVTLQGRLTGMGKADSVEVGFQYRQRRGATDLYEKTEPWKDTARVRRSAPGNYTIRLPGLPREQSFDYRAVVKHPLITTYGQEKLFETGK